MDIEFKHKLTSERRQIHFIAFNPGVDIKQEYEFPRQKFCNPYFSWSNFPPTTLIYQFLLVFVQQLFKVTKTHKKKEKPKTIISN